MEAPARMLVSQFSAFGSPDVLRPESRRLPKRGAGEVLVKLVGTSVNPVDCKYRSGNFKAPLVGKLPKVPGGDVAGTVHEVDPAFSRFRIGDRVFGLNDTFSPLKQDGSYAEFAAVKEEWLTEVPASISDEQAAAAPLVALTAYQALEPADLRPGSRVLVHGGSGGVGHVAMQLAKLRGARVVAVCSARNAAFCREYGADEVVDYAQQRFEQLYADQPFDAIVDLIGGSTWPRSMKVLKRGGHYAHIVSGTYTRRLPTFLNLSLEGIAAVAGYAKALATGGSYKLVLVEPNGSQMRIIAQLMDEGKLKIHVGRTFGLEKASDAHAAQEAGQSPGKIVILVGGAAS